MSTATTWWSMAAVRRTPGMPNFTRILGGQSHLDGAESFVKRDTAGE